jgi:cytochrome c oxidase cbb3-type subunit 4
MTLEQFFDSASSAVTLVSFITFIGIVWWTFSSRRTRDFESAAMLPFADGDDDYPAHEEPRRV